MAFHVGQKVVCIRGGNKPMKNGFVPVTNGIYTIRGFFHVQPSGEPRVWLQEYIHPGRLDGIEVGWNAKRFRPVIDRKSSISFTEGAPKDSETWDNRRKVEVRV